MTFDHCVDGKHVLAKTFASAANGRAWSANDAVDLGSLATDRQLHANALTLEALLTVTSASAGSGFCGDLIIGALPAGSGVNGIVTAMAEFRWGAGGMAVHQPVNGSGSAAERSSNGSRDGSVVWKETPGQRQPWEQNPDRVAGENPGRPTPFPEPHAADASNSEREWVSDRLNPARNARLTPARVTAPPEADA